VRGPQQKQKASGRSSAASYMTLSVSQEGCGSDVMSPCLHPLFFWQVVEGEEARPNTGRAKHKNKRQRSTRTKEKRMGWCQGVEYRGARLGERGVIK